MGIYGKLSELEEKTETKEVQVKPEVKIKKQISGVKKETTTPRYHGTMPPLHQDEIVETIRKAVKQFGKEAATYRFTQEEKKSLADIVYAYKGTGVRTSENEVSRVAINFLIEDYRENGENSVLARVIKRLNE